MIHQHCYKICGTCLEAHRSQGPFPGAQLLSHGTDRTNAGSRQQVEQHKAVSAQRGKYGGKPPGRRAVRCRSSSPGQQNFQGRHNIFFAKAPDKVATAASHLPKPKGVNNGARHLPKSAKMLSDGWLTASVRSNLCKNHKIPQPIKIIVPAFTTNAFIRSHTLLPTLFKFGSDSPEAP